jgi:hypothetical protein
MIEFQKNGSYTMLSSVSLACIRVMGVSCNRTDLVCPMFGAFHWARLFVILELLRNPQLYGCVLDMSALLPCGGAR